MDPIILQFLQQLAAQGTAEGQSLNQRGNFLQDFGDLIGIGDVGLGALSTGSTAFDPAAFQPIIDGYEEFDAPQRSLVDAYLANPDDGPEYALAEAVAAGRTPEAALRAMGVTMDDPSYKDLQKLGTKLFEDNSQYEQAVSALPKDPETGEPVYRRPKYSDSPMTKQFREAGLPTPFDRFSPADFYDQAARDGDLSRRDEADKRVKDAFAQLERSMIPDGQGKDNFDARQAKAEGDPEWVMGLNFKGLGPADADVGKPMIPAASEAGQNPWAPTGGGDPSLPAATSAASNPFAPKPASGSNPWNPEVPTSAVDSMMKRALERITAARSGGDPSGGGVDPAARAAIFDKIHAARNESGLAQGRVNAQEGYGKQRAKRAAESGDTPLSRALLARIMAARGAGI